MHDGLTAVALGPATQPADLPHRQPQDLGGLRHRLHGLVLDGRQREARRVRRGDDVRARGDGRRRHLVGRAADVQRAAAQAPGIQCSNQCRLVDQIAARRIDENGALLHGRELPFADEVFRFRRRDREGNDVIGFGDKFFEGNGFNPGSIGIAHQHPHSKSLPSRATSRPMAP